jgi:hypothetical protein
MSETNIKPILHPPIDENILRQAQPQIVQSKVVKVKGTQVILADYDLIRQDFPSLCSQSDQEIDQWLIDNFAWLAEAQVRLGAIGERNVHEKVPLFEGAEKLVYRPQGYTRSLVFPSDLTSPDGSKILVDIKGAGSENPTRGDHTTGILYLAEAIREFHFEKLIYLLFEHAVKDNFVERNSQTPMITNPVYAVIDLNCCYIYKHKFLPLREPFGLILRRSHLRGGDISDPEGFPKYENNPDIINLGVTYERTLRRYGLTTAIARKTCWKPQGFRDVANVQLTLNRELVDFGTIKILSPNQRQEDIVFCSKAHYYQRDENGNIFPHKRLQDPKDVDFLLRVTDPQYVQRDPQLSVDEKIWGDTFFQLKMPRNMDRPWIFSKILVDLFKKGLMNKSYFFRQHQAFLASQRQKLN